MNEHVNATAIFADECNVERLKAILRCAKEGMVRAEAAQELGIHYTALAHVIQILEIPFTSDRRGPKPRSEYRADAAKGKRRVKGMSVDVPAHRRATTGKRSRDSRIMRAVRGLIATGYSSSEAARMYGIRPEDLR